MKMKLTMLALAAATLPAIAHAGVVAQVSEPSTLALLGAGMATLLVVRASRRR